MKRSLAIAYIYDFLSRVFEEKISLDKVILFGSIAKGEFDAKSDIDLFIEPKQKSKLKEIEKKIKAIKNRFEQENEHTWGLKGIYFPIREQVGFLEDDVWKVLKQDIISTGIMLYGKYEELPEKLEHFSLINYSLESMKQKEKMKLLRLLFGYSTTKGKKIYRQEGLTHEFNGIKLSKNALLIPMGEIVKVKKIFDEFGARVQVREVWLRPRGSRL